MTTPLIFLRETRDELSKVTWPSQDEIIRLTLIVIFISIVVGAYIGGLDFLFTKLIAQIIK